MVNNFLIISDDKVVIDISIKDIIKQINNNDLDIIKYDYPDIPINSVLEELNTYNFLSNSKLVIYNNCSFLSKDNDKNIKYLKEYLNNPSENYLVMINDSLSEKKEIKELTEKTKVVNELIPTDKIIKDNLDDYKMDNYTIKYFCDYCLNNKEKILNELDKIKCYKSDSSDKNITVDDINKIVMKDYDDNIFDLVNAITRKNKEKAIELYNRLFQKEKDSVNIIGSVASNIRNLYSVKVLIEKKYKQNEIAECLGLKPYAVSILSENCNNYSSKRLLQLLDILADIDYKSKSGDGQTSVLFEMFLLSL